MRTRDESGATAVIVGLLSVVLFGVAALAVDLGNAWARERSVQKQVDISALSLGHLLPASIEDLPTLATAAAAYLTANGASGQEEIAATDLTNTSPSDGEVVLLDEDGVACSVECVRVELTAPEARVDFGLAGVLGRSGTSVQRAATVQVFSAIPRGESVLPFWLPSGCALGPAMLDVSPGNSGKFDAMATSSSTAPPPEPSMTTSASPTVSAGPTPDLTASATAGPTEVPTATATASGTTLPSDVQQGEHRIMGPVAPSEAGVGLTLTVGNLRLTNIPSNVDRASIRFVAPDGSWHEYAATDVGKTDPLVVPSFAIGPEVTATPGTWRVYGVLQQKNDNKLPQISVDFQTFTVNGPAPAPPPQTAEPEPEPAADSDMVDEVVVEPTTAVGCVGQQRGNFGQLDSPRKTGEGTADALALNIAKGLDHLLAPYPFGPGQTEVKDCSAGGTLIDGAQLDDQSRDGNNCITGLPGNRVSPLGPGFITGVGGSSGRLAAVRGTTTCVDRWDRYWGGALLNDDVLSCFLRDGYSLEDISQPAGVTTAMLDPAVVRSPRFVWVPVVNAADRVQKGYQPIRDFVPAFITDEGPLSTRTSSDATMANGLVLNGGGKQVQGVRVYAFNKDALPIEESTPTAHYDPVVGRKVARLIR